MLQIIIAGAGHTWTLRIQPMAGPFGTPIVAGESFNRPEDAMQAAEGLFGPLSWGAAGQAPLEARIRVVDATADPEPRPADTAIELPDFFGAMRRSMNRGY